MVKRSPLKPVSEKRKALNRERKELMEQAFGPRDTWKCQWGTAIRFAAVAVPASMMPCHGDINGHEVLKRSRGGSITDMTNVLTLCNYHNDLIEQEPLMAEHLGLSKHAWEAQ